jgi:hypothetical protein
MKDTSKKIFPKQGEMDQFSNVFHQPQFGMTLREYYAGQALAGMIVRQNDQAIPYEDFPNVVAFECRRIADALIAELEGGE